MKIITKCLTILTIILLTITIKPTVTKFEELVAKAHEEKNQLALKAHKEYTSTVRKAAIEKWKIYNSQAQQSLESKPRSNTKVKFDLPRSQRLSNTTVAVLFCIGALFTKYTLSLFLYT